MILVSVVLFTWATVRYYFTGKGYSSHAPPRTGLNSFFSRSFNPLSFISSACIVVFVLIRGVLIKNNIVAVFALPLSLPFILADIEEKKNVPTEQLDPNQKALADYVRKRVSLGFLLPAVEFLDASSLDDSLKEKLILEILDDMQGRRQINSQAVVMIFRILKFVKNGNKIAGLEKILELEESNTGQFRMDLQAVKDELLKEKQKQEYGDAGSLKITGSCETGKSIQFNDSVAVNPSAGVVTDTGIDNSREEREVSLLPEEDSHCDLTVENTGVHCNAIEIAEGEEILPVALPERKRRGGRPHFKNRAGKKPSAKSIDFSLLREKREFFKANKLPVYLLGRLGLERLKIRLEKAMEAFRSAGLTFNPKRIPNKLWMIAGDERVNPEFALGFEENGLNPCQDKDCEQKNRRRIQCNTPRTLLRVKRSHGKDLETFYRNPNANSGFNIMLANCVQRRLFIRSLKKALIEEGGNISAAAKKLGFPYYSACALVDKDRGLTKALEIANARNQLPVQPLQAALRESGSESQKDITATIPNILLSYGGGEAFFESGFQEGGLVVEQGLNIGEELEVEGDKQREELERFLIINSAQFQQVLIFQGLPGLISYLTERLGREFTYSDIVESDELFSEILRLLNGKTAIRARAAVLAMEEREYLRFQEILDKRVVFALPHGVTTFPLGREISSGAQENPDSVSGQGADNRIYESILQEGGFDERSVLRELETISVGEPGVDELVGMAGYSAHDVIFDSPGIVECLCIENNGGRRETCSRKNIVRLEAVIARAVELGICKIQVRGIVDEIFWKITEFSRDKPVLFSFCAAAEYFLSIQQKDFWPKLRRKLDFEIKGGTVAKRNKSVIASDQRERGPALGGASSLRSSQRHTNGILQQSQGIELILLWSGQPDEEKLMSALVVLPALSIKLEIISIQTLNDEGYKQALDFSQRLRSNLFQLGGNDDFIPIEVCRLMVHNEEISLFPLDTVYFNPASQEAEFPSLGMCRGIDSVYAFERFIIDSVTTPAAIDMALGSEEEVFNAIGRKLKIAVELDAALSTAGELSLEVLFRDERLLREMNFIYLIEHLLYTAGLDKKAKQSDFRLNFIPPELKQVLENEAVLLNYSRLIKKGLVYCPDCLLGFNKDRELISVLSSLLDRIFACLSSCPGVVQRETLPHPMLRFARNSDEQIGNQQNLVIVQLSEDSNEGVIASERSERSNLKITSSLSLLAMTSLLPRAELLQNLFLPFFPKTTNYALFFAKWPLGKIVMALLAIILLVRLVVFLNRKIEAGTFSLVNNLKGKVETIVLIFMVLLGIFLLSLLPCIDSKILFLKPAGAFLILAFLSQVFLDSDAVAPDAEISFQGEIIRAVSLLYGAGEISVDIANAVIAVVNNPLINEESLAESIGVSNQVAKEIISKVVYGNLRRGACEITAVYLEQNYPDKYSSLLFSLHKGKPDFSSIKSPVEREDLKNIIRTIPWHDYEGFAGNKQAEVMLHFMEVAKMSLLKRAAAIGVSLAGFKKYLTGDRPKMNNDYDIISAETGQLKELLNRRMLGFIKDISRINGSISKEISVKLPGNSQEMIEFIKKVSLQSVIKIAIDLFYLNRITAAQLEAFAFQMKHLQESYEEMAGILGISASVLNDDLREVNVFIPAYIKKENINITNYAAEELGIRDMGIRDKNIYRIAGLLLEKTWVRGIVEKIFLQPLGQSDAECRNIVVFLEQRLTGRDGNEAVCPLADSIQSQVFELSKGGGLKLSDGRYFYFGEKYNFCRIRKIFKLADSKALIIEADVSENGKDFIPARISMLHKGSIEEIIKNAVVDLGMSNPAAVDTFDPGLFPFEGRTLVETFAVWDSSLIGQQGAYTVITRTDDRGDLSLGHDYICRWSLCPESRVAVTFVDGKEDRLWFMLRKDGTPVKRRRDGRNMIIRVGRGIDKAKHIAIGMSLDPLEQDVHSDILKCTVFMYDYSGNFVLSHERLPNTWMEDCIIVIFPCGRASVYFAQHKHNVPKEYRNGAVIFILKTGQINKKFFKQNLDREIFRDFVLQIHSEELMTVGLGAYLDGNMQLAQQVLAGFLKISGLNCGLIESAGHFIEIYDTKTVLRLEEVRECGKRCLCRTDVIERTAAEFEGLLNDYCRNYAYLAYFYPLLVEKKELALQEFTGQAKYLEDIRWEMIDLESELAEEIFEALQSCVPLMPDEARRLYEAAVTDENLEKRLVLLSQAYSLAPLHPEILYELSYVLYWLKPWDQARESVEKTIRIAESLIPYCSEKESISVVMAKTYILLGLLYLDARATRSACLCSKKALELIPGNKQARVLNMIVKFNPENTRENLELCLELTELYPSSPIVWDLVYRLTMKLNEFKFIELAIAEIQKLVPQSARPSLYMVIRYIQGGRLWDAEHNIRFLLEKDPDNPDYLSLLGCIFLRIRNVRESLQVTLPLREKHSEVDTFLSSFEPPGRFATVVKNMVASGQLEETLRYIELNFNLYRQIARCHFLTQDNGDSSCKCGNTPCLISLFYTFTAQYALGRFEEASATVRSFFGCFSRLGNVLTMRLSIASGRLTEAFRLKREIEKKRGAGDSENGRTDLIPSQERYQYFYNYFLLYLFSGNIEKALELADEVKKYYFFHGLYYKHISAYILGMKAYLKGGLPGLRAFCSLGAVFLSDETPAFSFSFVLHKTTPAKNAVYQIFPAMLESRSDRPLFDSIDPLARTTVKELAMRHISSATYEIRDRYSLEAGDITLFPLDVTLEEAVDLMGKAVEEFLSGGGNSFENLPGWPLHIRVCYIRDEKKGRLYRFAAELNTNKMIEDINPYLVSGEGGFIVLNYWHPLPSALMPLIPDLFMIYNKTIEKYLSVVFGDNNFGFFRIFHNPLLANLDPLAREYFYWFVVLGEGICLDDQSGIERRMYRLSGECPRILGIPEEFSVFLELGKTSNTPVNIFVKKVCVLDFEKEEYSCSGEIPEALAQRHPNCILVEIFDHSQDQEFKEMVPEVPPQAKGILRVYKDGKQVFWEYRKGARERIIELKERYFPDSIFLHNLSSSQTFRIKLPFEAQLAEYPNCIIFIVPRYKRKYLTMQVLAVAYVSGVEVFRGYFEENSPEVIKEISLIISVSKIKEWSTPMEVVNEITGWRRDLSISGFWHKANFFIQRAVSWPVDKRLGLALQLYLFAVTFEIIGSREADEIIRGFCREKGKGVLELTDEDLEILNTHWLLPQGVFFRRDMVNLSYTIILFIMPVIERIFTSDWMRESFANEGNRSDMRRFIESVAGGIPFKERGFRMKFNEFEPLTVHLALEQKEEETMADVVSGVDIDEAALALEIISWKELSLSEIVLKAQELTLRASREKWSDRILIFALAVLTRFGDSIYCSEFPIDAVCGGMPVLFNRAKIEEGQELLFVYKQLASLSEPELGQLNDILYRFGWWALKKNGSSQLGYFFNLFIGPVISSLKASISISYYERKAIEQEVGSLIGKKDARKQKGKRK